MPASWLLAREAFPPGTFDGDRNFLPEKAQAGFALWQCKMTAGRGCMARNSAAFSHIDESQCLLHDGLAQPGRNSLRYPGKLRYVCHWDVSRSLESCSTWLHVPSQEGKTQSGIFSVPRLVAEGINEKNQEQ